MPQQPDNTTKIQFRTTFGMNYDFVAKTPVAVSQIYQLMPQAINYSLGIPQSAAIISNLIPDTSASVGYVPTIIQGYIPSSQVDALQLQVLNAGSSFYNNPSGSVSALAGLVDSTFPLIAANAAPGSPADTATDSTATGSSNSATDAAAPLGGDSSSSAPVQTKALAIAFPTIAVAAVYGAAMFFVTRRYRKKKARHARSSSMIDTANMRQTENGGVVAGLMSGGRGEGYRSTTPNRGGATSRGSDNSGSARTQMISAPVMAENSLGWN